MDIWTVFFVPTVILVGLVIPLWLVFHYITRWREQKRRFIASEEQLEQLWHAAERLEKRLQTLKEVVEDDGANRKR